MSAYRRPPRSLPSLAASSHGEIDQPDVPTHARSPRIPGRLIPATLVAKHLPRSRRGKKVHRTTVLRWMTRGCRGVVLDSVFIGGRRYTDLDSIRRFISASTDKFGGTPALHEAAAAKPDAPPHRPTRGTRARTDVDRQAAIERDLRRFGL